MVPKGKCRQVNYARDLVKPRRTVSQRRRRREISDFLRGQGGKRDHVKAHRKKSGGVPMFVKGE